MRPVRSYFWGLVLLFACDVEEATPRAGPAPAEEAPARPLTRVLRAGGEASLVLAGATPGELDRLSRAVVEDPRVSLDPLGYRGFTSVEPRWLDRAGGWRVAEVEAVALRGDDPVLGDSFMVDLLAVEGPDGRRFVAHPLAPVAAPTPSPVDPSLLLLEREFGLFLIEAEAGVVHPLGDATARATALRAAEEVPLVDEGPPLVWATAPQWSPDGAQIAFLSTRGGDPAVPELWIHAVDRGEERRVAAPAAPVRLVGWIDDDALLVEDHGDPARPRVAAIDVDRGSLRSLAEGVVIARAPGGEVVALAAGEPERLRIDVLDLSSGAVETLVALRPGELLRSWQADFSDDGARLVADLTDAEGTHALLIAGRDGAARRVPLPGPGQLAGEVVWLGERLLVPLEDLSARTATTHLVTAP